MVRRNIRAVERLAGGGGGGLAATPGTPPHLSLTHQLNTHRSCSPDRSAVAEITEISSYREDTSLPTCLSHG